MARWRPPVDDRQHRICLLRREHRDDPPNAYLRETLQTVGIRREAEQGDFYRVGITPGLLRHVAELRQDIAEIAPRYRDPAIAVADRATRALREGYASMDGRMGLCHRLRPRDHRAKLTNSPWYSACSFVQICFIASIDSRMRLKRLA